MKKLFVLLSVLTLGIVLGACNGTSSLNNQTNKNIVTGKINVYTRDAVSGTREAFQSIIGFESSQLIATAIETNGNGDLATKVGNDKYGIGYVSLSTDFAANKIKALKFDGVIASEVNVINGKYKLQRPFSYTSRLENDFVSDNVKNMTAAFIAFLGTKDGISVLNANHVIVDSANAPTWNSIKAQYLIINNAEKVNIRIGGSTSVETSVKAVAEAFKAVAPAFDFTMDQTGSGDGYKRTLGSNKDNSPIEIGFASRTFKSEEDVTVAYKSGVIGFDAIAVVVEKNNPMENITKEDLKKIFIGDINNWENVLNLNE